MFGNKIGWAISAVLVLLWCGLIWLIYSADATTLPTPFSLDSSKFGKLQLPVDPASLLPAMSVEKNAGDLYRKAMGDYDVRGNYYDGILSSKTIRPADLKQLPLVDCLVQATPFKNITLMTATPADVLNYKTEKRAIVALMNVGSITLIRGTSP